MNFKFKTLVTGMKSLLCAGLLLSVIPAKAEVGTITFGCTNLIASNSIVGVNLGGYVDVQDQEYVDVTMRWISGSANAGNITAFLQRSSDTTAATTETVPSFVFTAAQIATQGATNVIKTNLSTTYIGPTGFLKLYALSNSVVVGNASNFSLTIGKKKVLVGR